MVIQDLLRWMPTFLRENASFSTSRVRLRHRTQGHSNLWLPRTATWPNWTHIRSAPVVRIILAGAVGCAAVRDSGPLTPYSRGPFCDSRSPAAVIHVTTVFIVRL